MAFEVIVQPVISTFFFTKINFKLKERHGIICPTDEMDPRSPKEKCCHHGQNNLGIHSREEQTSWKQTQHCPINYYSVNSLGFDP